MGGLGVRSTSGVTLKCFPNKLPFRKDSTNQAEAVLLFTFVFAVPH